MARPQLFGKRDGMTYETTVNTITNGKFVKIDGSKSATPVTNFFGFVTLAGAGNTPITDKVVGVCTSGMISGKRGITGETYPTGARINVVQRGVVYCSYDKTDANAPVRDDFVKIGTNGIVTKWTAATSVTYGTLTTPFPNTYTVTGATNAAQEIAEKAAAAFIKDRQSIVGRVVGDPDSTTETVAVMLFGFPNFQE